MKSLEVLSTKDKSSGTSAATIPRTSRLATTESNIPAEASRRPNIPDSPIHLFIPSCNGKDNVGPHFPWCALGRLNEAKPSPPTLSQSACARSTTVSFDSRTEFIVFAVGMFSSVWIVICLEPPATRTTIASPVNRHRGADAHQESDRDCIRSKTSAGFPDQGVGTLVSTRKPFRALRIKAV